MLAVVNFAPSCLSALAPTPNGGQSNVSPMKMGDSNEQPQALATASTFMLPDSDFTFVATNGGHRLHSIGNMVTSPARNRIVDDLPIDLTTPRSLKRTFSRTISRGYPVSGAAASPLRLGNDKSSFALRSSPSSPSSPSVDMESPFRSRPKRTPARRSLTRSKKFRASPYGTRDDEENHFLNGVPLGIQPIKRLKLTESTDDDDDFPLCL